MTGSPVKTIKLDRRAFFRLLFAPILACFQKKPTKIGFKTRYGMQVVGYKGSTYLESGYIYTPYIPLQINSLYGSKEWLNQIKIKTNYCPSYPHMCHSYRSDYQRCEHEIG